MAEINATDVSQSSIYPGLDESSRIQELISQYLAHEGYVETAKDFAQDVQAARHSLQEDDNTDEALDLSQNVDAINRQSKQDIVRQLTLLTFM